MAIDPRLSLEVKSPDVMGNAKLGTDLAYEQQNNPILIQQAQTNLEFDQANNPTLLKRNQADLSSVLTQTERDKLSLQEETRKNEFQKYLQTNQPGLDPETGRIDPEKAAVEMARAGHGMFALGYQKQVLDNALTKIKNADDLRIAQDSSVRGAANTISAMPETTPQEKADKQKAINGARDYIAKQTGADPSVTHGPDWYKSGRYSGIGPTEQVSNEATSQQIAVSKRSNYMDDAAKDPNSSLNKAWQAHAAQIAPGVQVPATLAEASRVPGLGEVVGSFEISAETRASSAQTATQAAAAVTGVDNLLARSQAFSSKFPFKAGEKLKNVYKGVTNDADRAELDAWVADAERIIGRPVDRDAPVSGVLNTLKSIKDQAATSGRQALSQVGATSFSRTPAGGYNSTNPESSSPAGQTEAAPPATTPASQKEGVKLAGTYVATRGRFMGQKQTFTAEQLSNPETAAKLRSHIASGMLKKL